VRAMHGECVQRVVAVDVRIAGLFARKADEAAHVGVIGPFGAGFPDRLVAHGWCFLPRGMLLDRAFASLWWDPARQTGAWSGLIMPPLSAGQAPAPGAWVSRGRLPAPE